MSVSVFDSVALEKLRAKCRLDPHKLTLFRRAFFKRGLPAAKALVHLPEPMRTQIQCEFLQLEKRQVSSVDAASKLLFRTHDGLPVESVLLQPTTGRVALCISCQVGCACACSFCATGRMGLTRDLTSSEMLDQVIQANRLLASDGLEVRNVVFMGMGEPLHNEAEVYGALDVMLDPLYLNLPARRITVSTVGIADAMLRFSRKYPEVNLALSLHSARQDQREKMIPVARQYSLDRLRATMEQLSGEVFVEYLLLAGVNDSDEDLLALRDLLKGLRVHVNLIPYNAVDGAALQGSAQKRRDVFAAALKKAGFTVTMRYSLGSDIDAACGQLASR